LKNQKKSRDGGGIDTFAPSSRSGLLARPMRVQIVLGARL
jgi:hypothetical protein